MQVSPPGTSTSQGSFDSGPRRVVGGHARLEAHGLECIRDDRVLFSDLSFVLEAGEVLQLEGRNGSGKTTLLHILCGMRLPDRGGLTWCGEAAEDLGSEYLGEIAYVGHAAGVKRELTPLENLRIARAVGTPKDGTRLEEALDHVGLYGFEDLPARNLSAGQTRRVALARLLVTEASLWILDEPFTALDRSGIVMLEALLKRHTAAGGMIALTTHHHIALGDTQVTHLNLSK